MAQHSCSTSAGVMKTLSIFPIVFMVAMGWALGQPKRLDLPFSTSDPSMDLHLDDTVVSELPPVWHHPAQVGSSHFVRLGRMAGSSSMLHLAFDLDIGALNRTLETACNPIMDFKSQIFGEGAEAASKAKGKDHLSRHLKSIFELLETECSGYRELVVHAKDAFINRFGMDVDEAKVLDKHLRVLERNQTASIRREKRQVALLMLIGMGIVAVGSYLFSSHQVAQISVATGADSTTIK